MVSERERIMDINIQTEKNSDEMSNTGKLLTVHERTVCESLSGGEIPYSQWAQALLAIDEGASQAESAQRAGLTNNQVRYWLAKFRKLGLGIFPQQSLESTTEEVQANLLEAPVGEEQVETNTQEFGETGEVKRLEAEVEEAPEKSKAKNRREKKKVKKSKETSEKKGGRKGKSKKGKKSKKSKIAGKKKNKKTKKSKR